MTMLAEVDFAAMDGVTLWRRIADELRLDIAGGALPVGSRLPGEAMLAQRFGVNRHTVRAALKALERDGLVRARQGSGTFVAAMPSTTLGHAAGERLSVGISGAVAGAETVRLSSATELPPPAVAMALWLDPDDPVTRLELLTRVDGGPLSRGTSWFSAGRFPGIDAVFDECGSVSAAFRHYGITTYLRATTRLSARRAELEEARALNLSPAAIVMVAEGVEVVPEGRPVEFSLTRFAAERVDLVLLGE
jgi:GntR family phosphonate transport system transcriptional regulator